MSIYDRLNGTQAPDLRQIQNDPIGAAQKAGYNIPENLRNDPRAMFMHMMQTGQIQNPMLQRIMPMIQRLGIK